ncbi:MAG: phBC6A51 family helix-turn-helix protein [Ruminococcus sp.]|nr:phBC6A51 family helix-turn-helix protein [Ruminococcus sp.]
MSQNVTNSENTVIDARMAIAAELLANPDFSGTKSDIAEKAGVTSRTLYRWLRNPDFVALVNQLVAQYADAELAMVWKSLCKQIKAGNLQAIRLYFELRERGKQTASNQLQDDQTSKLYETLGADDETNYETFAEAETGAEMGTSDQVQKSESNHL